MNWKIELLLLAFGTYGLAILIAVPIIISDPTKLIIALVLSLFLPLASSTVFYGILKPDGNTQAQKSNGEQI